MKKMIHCFKIGNMIYITNPFGNGIFFNALILKIFVFIRNHPDLCDPYFPNYLSTILDVQRNNGLYRIGKDTVHKTEFFLIKNVVLL